MFRPEVLAHRQHSRYPAPFAGSPRQDKPISRQGTGEVLVVKVAVVAARAVRTVREVGLVAVAKAPGLPHRCIGHTRYTCRQRHHQKNNFDNWFRSMRMTRSCQIQH